MGTEIDVAVHTLLLMCTAIMITLPLVWIDHAGRKLYCTDEDDSTTSTTTTTTTTTASSKRPWCEQSGGTLYGFVQKEYWNQGLFNYWTLAQLPNFLLAAPILYTCFVMFQTFVIRGGGGGHGSSRRKDWSIVSLRTLGMITEEEEEEEAVALIAAAAREENEDERKRKSRMLLPMTNELLIPIVFHCFALAVLCLFCMHVQVATRFLLASSPCCYWYWSDVLVEEERKMEKKQSCIRPRRVLLLYFWCFNVIGIVLFSSFYPWT